MQKAIFQRINYQGSLLNKIRSKLETSHVVIIPFTRKDKVFHALLSRLVFAGTSGENKYFLVFFRALLCSIPLLTSYNDTSYHGTFIKVLVFFSKNMNLQTS